RCPPSWVEAIKPAGAASGSVAPRVLPGEALVLCAGADLLRSGAQGSPARALEPTGSSALSHFLALDFHVSHRFLEPRQHKRAQYLCPAIWMFQRAGEHASYEPFLPRVPCCDGHDVAANRVGHFALKQQVRLYD